MADWDSVDITSRNYCNKHNQLYMDHLSDCPICIGEKMKPAMPSEPITYNREKPVKRVPLTAKRVPLKSPPKRVRLL